MRDQSPSAGILRSEDGVTIYHVPTIWFDQVVFRNYEIRSRGRGGEPEVRPLGSPVVGRDSVVFLLSGAEGEERSRFRLLCCV